MLVSDCQRLVTLKCTARRTRHTPHYTLHATDCIGTSVYAAKQGRLVKVWGLLYKGHLSIHVLPEDVLTRSGSAHMNQGRHQKKIRLHAKRWLRECNEGRLPLRAQLVQDDGRCLWASCSLEVSRSNHIHSTTDYPPSNHDTNVIEGVWAHMRTKLHASAPRGIEKRKDFIQRLHDAVRALNNSGRT